MKPQHPTPPSATAIFPGLSSWGSRILLSLALLSPVGGQAANYQYINTSTPYSGWADAVQPSTRWNQNNPPWSGTAPSGGPTAADNLDLAAPNGGGLNLSTNTSFGINNLSASLANQGLGTAGDAGFSTTLTVGGNLSVGSGGASLLLTNSNLNRSMSVQVQGNVSVSSGGTLFLGNNASSSAAGRLTSFVVQGTSIVEGTLNNYFLNTTAQTTNLGALIVNGTFTGSYIGEVTAPATVNASPLIQMRSLSGTGTITGSNVNANGSRLVSLAIQTTSTSNSTFSGVIRDSSVTQTGTGINQLDLQVSGIGRQTLTGVNTYTGTTTVTGGELIISGDGSINNTSSITINGGSFKHNSSVGLNRNVTLTTGTFGYSSANNYTGTLTYTAGTLAGTNWNGSLNNQTIGTGKTISPGNSPGTATTGSQTWAGGGSFNWEINNATGSAGTNWDLINFTTGLTVSSTLENPFVINIISLTGNDPGNAANFNSGTNYSWLFADSAATISTYALEKFSLNLAGFTNAYAGDWSIARGDESGLGDDSQLFIIYSIPEPNTAAAALFAVGAFLLLGRRRKA